MTDFLREQRCAEALAREAGYILNRGRKGDIDVDFKGINDPVTEIDLAIEEFLVEQLEQMFPEDHILGEELGRRGASRQDARTWCIDPVDGTHNLSRSIPFSCISIALLEDEKPLAAVVYDPYRDELFSTSEGEPTRLDGCDAETSETDTLSAATVATGFPRNAPELTEKNLDHFNTLTRSCRGVRRLGAAALDLAYLAVGRLDGFWEYGLHPWDTAAGILLVENAGGDVTTIAGDSYDVQKDSILASNGTLRPEIEEELNRG
jgi:myo-inositol-1(or 4)-monophosphatase